VMPGWPMIESDRLRLTFDTATGAIASLVWKPGDVELVDRRARPGLGEYLYVPGTDSLAAQSLSRVTFGGTLAPPPLVAWQSFSAAAPGARSFTEEIRVVAGLDRVDVVLRFDKLPVREKEAVHVAFPFRVPDGQVRFDVASGIVRPDSEQLPGSLRNFVTVQSWADVSNDAVGVTWATPDAPLVEVGGIFAELPWMRSIPPTQTLLSYAMNNYWHTNFKAEQGGPVEFRFALRPHGPYRSEDAVRFGMEQRAPLLVVPGSRVALPSSPLLTVSPAAVVVTSIKPASDGRGWLVQFQNPTDATQQVRLVWRRGTATALWLSDSSERRGTRLTGTVPVPARGTVMVRAERAAAGR
jgi:alpha-mannosidase